MQDKVLFGLLAIAACATAASISGIASLNPAQFFVGGQIRFPRIPGINYPLFGFRQPSNTTNNNSTQNGTSSSSNMNYNGSPFGPFTPFLRLIPGLNLLIPRGRSSFSPFPNVNDLISRIPGLNNDDNDNGNGTRNGNRSITVPPFRLPSINDGPYIPGVSEALKEAREHLMASLNISTDLSTGIRDAVQVALEGDNPADSIGIIMNTIASVYSTVAAHCPLIVVGTRVFNEGVRLAYEVARSIANVAVGPENNNII